MDLSEFTFDELKTVASELDGFEFDGRWGEGKLRDALNAYFEENPVDDGAEESAEEVDSEEVDVDTLEVKTPEVPPEVAEPETPEAQEKRPSSGKSAKIQSAYRGVIMTSEGPVDFGEDGIATVTAELAERLITLEGYELCK